ncbi:methylated-DNA--[protein]-cysteine S-methyltransferase [Pseudidiomarina donghaiensis]|uniref:Methylated-DNA--protein-cysteine methyltransferase n=1 Tax=Pseudidiomarina donghaiensis TaxID=519452 RepID=A0A432XIU6_9GAMM|nr:methylated-DNA--[protein]-cysteine S-methyltransferase [Pseudidiomarina donghaiensis]RUO48546.1 cysteine methyltransferase [Pseudidiomarina donghaiensis]SFV23929.1 methylated-DNA-[protein]-cysteine S-methyltransferase [Pseudidiomarina donghaiensis]
MFQSTLQSPLGPVTATSENGNHITDVSFCAPLCQRACTVTEQAAQQLLEYFNGKRLIFDLPLAPAGTDFQQQVWQALLSVSYGHTASYGDIARLIKNPKGVRAVGLANSRNPIAIIIPCHRIIGANGTLTGYAGGLDKKEWLLRHENAL